MKVTPKKLRLSTYRPCLVEAAIVCNYDYMSTEEGAERLRGWFSGRLPEDWFDGAPEVVLDREEITVVGRLTEPEIGRGRLRRRAVRGDRRPHAAVPRGHA